MALWGMCPLALQTEEAEHGFLRMANPQGHVWAPA